MDSLKFKFRNWGSILEFTREILARDSWLCPLLNMRVKKRQKNKLVCENFSSELENSTHENLLQNIRFTSFILQKFIF